MWLGKLCGGLSTKPHSPGVWSVVWFGFAWLAWFCVPSKKVFPFSGLGEVVATIFQQLFEVNWAACLSETREMRPVGKASLYSAPTPWEAELGRQRACKGSRSDRFLCPGEEVDTRESPDYHLLPKLLHDTPVCLAFFTWERCWCHLVLCVSCDQVFSLAFWVFVQWRSGEERGRGKGVGLIV